jgi:hypothetical protein
MYYPMARPPGATLGGMIYALSIWVIREPVSPSSARIFFTHGKNFFVYPANVHVCYLNG